VKTLSRFVSSLRESGPTTIRLDTVAYKLTADVVSKAVTLVVVVAAARRLPTYEVGVLALAMTTGWLLSVASDAGLPIDLARAVARRTAVGRLPATVVADAMRWRVRLGLAAAVVGAVIGTWLAPSQLLPFVLIVASQLVNATLETLAHAFRGAGRADLDARLTLAQRTVTGVAACGVLLAWPSLVWLAAALVVPPLVALGVARSIAQRMTIHPFGPNPRDQLLASRYLHDVAPMGIGIFLSAVYFRCDIFFIERWHGLEAVGIYNAAFRSVEALRLVPAALMAVVFPAFCTARTLRPLAATVGWLLAAAALPAAALLVAAPPILDLVYGAPFVVAAPALTLLGLAVPLFFVNYALTHQVLAWDGQRAYLGIVCAALATSLSANLALVPTAGMRGAAIATLLTELVVAGGSLAALAWLWGRVRDVSPIAGSTDAEPLRTAPWPGASS
jgi:O-antigen/teichoic acid export membrane protein